MPLMDYVSKKLNRIDKISGDHFESYATYLLSKIGYKHMIHTPMINDHGLDAYGYTEDGKKIGFQFKRFKGSVSYNAVYETLGGGIYYHTQINVLLTNSHFTNNTYKTCFEMNKNNPHHPILLWDRNKLRNLLYKVYKKELPQELKKKEANLLNTPFIKYIINLFNKDQYKIKNIIPRYEPVDFIMSKDDYRIGVKFIFYHSFNGKIPRKPLKKLAKNIRKHIFAQKILIVSGSSFTSREYNYFRDSYKSNKEFILIDYNYIHKTHPKYVSSLLGLKQNSNVSYKSNKLKQFNLPHNSFVKDVLNLFQSNKFNIKNVIPYKNPINFIAKKNNYKIGITFIYLNSFRGTVPKKPLKTIARHIEHYTPIRAFFIISGNSFTLKEHNYFKNREKNNYKNNKKFIILKDYKDLHNKHNKFTTSLSHIIHKLKTPSLLYNLFVKNVINSLNKDKFTIKNIISYNDPIDFIAKKNNHKIGIKFIYLKKFNKKVPNIALKKIVEHIRKYTSIKRILIISGYSFTNNERNYLDNINHNEAQQFILRDHKNFYKLHKHILLSLDLEQYENSYHKTIKLMHNSLAKKTFTSIPTDNSANLQPLLYSRSLAASTSSSLAQSIQKYKSSLSQSKSLSESKSTFQSRYNSEGTSKAKLNSLSSSSSLSVAISNYASMHASSSLADNYNSLRDSVSARSARFQSKKNSVSASVSYRKYISKSRYRFWASFASLSTTFNPLKTRNKHKYVPFKEANKYVGSNFHKLNVFYNKILLKHFVKDIKKLFKLKKFNIIKFHHDRNFNFILISKNKKHYIGVKFIFVISQLFNTNNKAIQYDIHSFKRNKKYKVQKILIITNGTFTPQNFSTIHSKYPNIYLEDYNLLNLEEKVNNNNSIDKLLNKLNINDNYLYQFITEKSRKNIDYNHKTLLSIPFVHHLIKKLIHHNIEITIPEPTGYSLDFLIHYPYSSTIGIKFMLRMSNKEMKISLTQLNKVINRVPKNYFLNLKTIFFITNHKFNKSCIKNYSKNKNISLLDKNYISTLLVKLLNL